MLKATTARQAVPNVKKQNKHRQPQKSIIDSQVRTNNRELAQSSLILAESLELTNAEPATVADEFDHVAVFVRELDTQAETS